MRALSRFAIVFHVIGGSVVACSKPMPAPKMISALELESLNETESPREEFDQHITLETIPLSGSNTVRATRPVVEEVHRKAVLREEVEANLLEVQGCYSSTSDSGETKLISLSLEINADGRVIGGSTQPLGGQQGIAAVADCLLSLAKSWTFVARRHPGRTVLVIPFQ